MDAVFLKLLNMSITASWLVLAVILCRFVLKKAPKFVIVIMWALVGIRLICPISFSSIFSLIPSAETIPENIIHTGLPENGNISHNTVTQSAVNSIESVIGVVDIATIVWLIGVLMMLLYTIVSYFRIHKSICESLLIRDNVFICDKIDTPFILGIVNPKIYLPSDMNEQDMKYVIAHEKAHLGRYDHLWKPVGFLLLSVYWFNPVLWLGYVLLCRDIELACDEKVIKEMGSESKKPYSNALINCSVPRKRISACPLAFGEVGVEARIKSVLSYKKPAFWIIVIAIGACVVLTVGFLTDPAARIDKDLSAFIESSILEHHKHQYSNKYFGCADFEVLGTEKDKDTVTVYMWALYLEYRYDNGLIEEGGAHIPTVITVQKSDYGYSLIEYWEPRDGSFYPQDIKNKFPFYLHYKAIDSQSYIAKQKKACQAKAQSYFNDDTSARLTLNDVITLSQKGEELEWKDFEDYKHVDTGSGLYIWFFEIDEMFSLYIGGGNTNEKPMYIYLRASDAFDESIDIRHGGVEEFIEEHKNNPVVEKVSAGWRCCPVGYKEDTYRKMIGYGGIPHNSILDHVRTLPVVKITNRFELQSFLRAMNGVMAFNKKYADVTSFSESIEEYTDEYFNNTSLFLVYVTTASTHNRFSVEDLVKLNGTLSISIAETVPDSDNAEMEGWLIAIGVPREQISDIVKFEARHNITHYPDSGTANAQVLRTYSYRQSKNIIKPSITLYDNGIFTFTFSALSSYIATGGYAFENDRLTLKTDDGKFIYVFDVVDDTLVFDAQLSSKTLWFSDICDGAVFE